MFVCGQMDGWRECDCEKERKAKGRMEGGVDHLILCSKKQRCSLQMSAAFSSAQMKKKVLRSALKIDAGEGSLEWHVSLDLFGLWHGAESEPVRLCCCCFFSCFLSLTPPTPFSCSPHLLALLRWPRDVCASRLVKAPAS